jgi:hypothetical protein
MKCINKFYIFKENQSPILWEIYATNNIFHFHAFISFTSFRLKTKFGHRNIKSIKKFYIFKENQLRILWEMWLGIFFTFILSSHSHHFVWTLNLVTDQIQLKTEIQLLKTEINCWRLKFSWRLNLVLKFS